MAKQPCAGCRVALVQRGYCDKCSARSPRKLAEQHRTATRDKRIKGLYDSAAWRKLRLGFLAHHPDCTDPYGLHVGRVVAAEHVDHIVPHKGDTKLFWARDNRQGLCASCHSVKTAREDGGFGRPLAAAEKKV